ncbi:MAG: hypothetical protein U1F43_12695 [Myxococcota bacterium]
MPREEGRLSVCATDGGDFLEARLGWLVERRASGARTMVVFDLDNTIFDTRPRTLAVARAFDAERGSHWFDRLGPGDVRHDGRATASQAALGPVPPDVVDAFASYWEDAFWRPESFAADLPIACMVAWARAARAVGAELRFLTGRIAALHAVSLAALERIGLGVPAPALACKPDLATRTAPWKCAVLAEWAREAAIGWFVTEGRRDTARVQAELPAMPCVLLDCSFESPAHAIAAGTPVLDRAF